MYIDTHCHLNFSDFDRDRSMVIGNAKKAGVKKLIVPGTDALSSKRAVGLTQTYPGVVFAAVGFHPYEAQKTPDAREALEQLFSKNVVAVGECGLDYHIYKGEKAGGKKDTQKRLFEAHLEIALRRNLPVIIHCRDAWEDLFAVLDSQADLVRGVLHCFSGGLQEIRMASERKLFIGIDGNVTYAAQLEMVIPHVPLSLIVLETDAPYLTPVPHRGIRNEPKYIPLIGKKVAQLTLQSPQFVEHQTTQNVQQLFRIE